MTNKNMTPEQKEQFVKDYCADLQRTMLDNLQHFRPEWNGLHIRAMAQMIVIDHTGNVKRAEQSIRKTTDYFMMKF